MPSGVKNQGVSYVRREFTPNKCEVVSLRSDFTLNIGVCSYMLIHCTLTISSISIAMTLCSVIDCTRCSSVQRSDRHLKRVIIDSFRHDSLLHCYNMYAFVLSATL